VGSSKSKERATTNYKVSPVVLNIVDEIQRGKDYVHSIQSTERKLVFVHIPKAAGSAIEEMGGKPKLKHVKKQVWGSCLFNHRPRRPGGVCQYPNGFQWPSYVGWWHLPPSFFPLMGTDPYHHADLFVVVRDVSERLVSEYYYICRKKINKTSNTVAEDCNRSRISDPDYLNEWLERKLQPQPQISSSAENNSKPRRMSARDYLRENGHFSPQSHFIVTPTTNVRYVDYVLRLDGSLERNFQRLMKAYGLDGIQAPPTKTNTVRNDITDLNAENINPRIHRLIHEKYHHDFDIIYNDNKNKSKASKKRETE
jgi:hypothetical protein